MEIRSLQKYCLNMRSYFNFNQFSSESENEPNRTELKRFGLVRVEPVRTRTDILKNESNRTEPEPAF